MSKAVEGEQQVVAFRLDQETYGVDIERVKEIITMQSLTKIPRASENLEGIINLRGQVIPVYNLRRKFGLMEKDSTKSCRIVVVEVNDATVGIIVDEVAEVLRISAEVVEAPADMLIADISHEFIEGIAKLDDRMIILLNLSLIFDINPKKIISATN